MLNATEKSLVRIRTRFNADAALTSVAVEDRYLRLEVVVHQRQRSSFQDKRGYLEHEKRNLPILRTSN